MTPAVPRTLIDAAAVQRRVTDMAAEIAPVLHGRAPVAVGILNGAAPFMMDLLRALPAPLAAELTYDFVDAASYEGTRSTGTVTLSRDPSVDVAGRSVLLVDGIVDTGRTLRAVIDALEARGAAGIRTCALLDKPARRQVEVQVDHVGFTIDDLFVVGYGMDLDQRYRGLRYIGVVDDS